MISKVNEAINIDLVKILELDENKEAKIKAITNLEELVEQEEKHLITTVPSFDGLKLPKIKEAFISEDDLSRIRELDACLFFAKTRIGEELEGVAKALMLESLKIIEMYFEIESNRITLGYGYDN